MLQHGQNRKKNTQNVWFDFALRNKKYSKYSILFYKILFPMQQKAQNMQYSSPFPLENPKIRLENNILGLAQLLSLYTMKEPKTKENSAKCKMFENFSFNIKKMFSKFSTIFNMKG